MNDRIEEAANLGKRFPAMAEMADGFVARYNVWCAEAKPNKAQVDASPFVAEAEALCKQAEGRRS